MYPPAKSLGNTVGSRGVCSADGCQSTSAKQNFSKALLVLWPVSRAKVFPLFLCVIPLGLFALVVFNRWRICRELRELAWQEWIDSVSPIARQCGIESAVIRLSDRWRNYFERGLSPEHAVLQYKSECMAGHQQAARGAAAEPELFLGSF